MCSGTLVPALARPAGAGGLGVGPPSHLELPPGIELFQAFYGLLPVHHGGHGGPLLWGEGPSHPAKGSEGGQLRPSGGGLRAAGPWHPQGHPLQQQASCAPCCPAPSPPPLSACLPPPHPHAPGPPDGCVPHPGPRSASTLRPLTHRTGPPLPGAPTFPETEALQTPQWAPSPRPRSTQETRGDPSAVRRGPQGARAGGTYANPRVFQRFVCCDALGGVDGQHLVDEVFGFRSDRVPLGGRKLEEEATHEGV